MSNYASIEEAISTLRRAMIGAKDRLGEGLQLTRTQLEILLMLSQEEQTTSDLARRLFLTRGAVTQTVNTLVRRHFIRREAAAHDRRIILLQLTTEGRQLTSRVQALRHQFIERLADQLTPNETETLLTIARKLTLIFEDQHTPKTND